MRVIDTRVSVPFEDRIRDEAAPTDTNEQIAARSAELDRTIGENDARRATGNRLVNQPSIHFGGVQLPTLPAGPYDGVVQVDVQRQNGDVVRNVITHTLRYGVPHELTVPFAYSPGDKVVVRVEVDQPKDTLTDWISDGESDNALTNAPAGEATLEARVVALSRASLAARIRHGVRLSDLAGHIEALTAGEEALLK